MDGGVKLDGSYEDGMVDTATRPATLFGVNVTEMLDFAKENAVAVANKMEAFSSVAGPADKFIAHVSNEIKGTNPSPELVAEADRLAETLKNNTGLTQSLQEALLKHPELATLLTGPATDDASKLAGITSMNDTLANPDNARLVANVLEYAANNPDGAAAVKAITKVRDFAALHASGEASQEDYAEMNTYLEGIGVKDDRLALASDPKQIWTMFMEDPQRLVQMMMNQFDMSGMDPMWKEMLAGFATMMTKGLSAFVNPNGDFVGHYYKEVVLPVGDALRETGKETLAHGSDADIERRMAEAGQGTPVAPKASPTAGKASPTSDFSKSADLTQADIDAAAERNKGFDLGPKGRIDSPLVPGGP